MRKQSTGRFFGNGVDHEQASRLPLFFPMKKYTKERRGKMVSLFNPVGKLFHKFSLMSRSSSISSVSSVRLPSALTEEDEWTTARWAKEVQKSDLYADFTLTQIELWKHKEGAQHEILVAEFKRRDYPVYIGMDRTTPGPRIIPDQTEIQRITTNSSTSVNQAIGASTNKPSEAYDSVWLKLPKIRSIDEAVKSILNSQGPEGTKLFEEYKREGRAATDSSGPAHLTPNLVHFSLAAKAASDVEVHYAPLTVNCYWFARAVVFILNTKFPGAAVFTHPGSSRQGQFKFLGISWTVGTLTEDQKERLINMYERHVSNITFRPCRCMV